MQKPQYGKMPAKKPPAEACPWRWFGSCDKGLPVENLTAFYYTEFVDQSQ